MRFTWVLVVCAACGSQSSSPGQPDARGIDAAAPIDAAASPAPAAFAPLHIDPTKMLTGAPAVTWTTATAIDTTAMKIAGQANSFFVQQGNYAVLYTDALTISAPVTITGAMPLIVVATGHIEVGGNVSLFGDGAVPGPGATATGPGLGGNGQTMAEPEGERSSGGGAGGSYGSLGAVGGAPGIAGGTIGTLYGGSPTAPLSGGAAGGIGGDATTNGGVGGGAIQLSSAVSITVGAFEINAGGGGGGAGFGFQGGGGGGAGGEILLEAPSLIVRGVLAANGGGGGGGGSGDGNGQFAAPGQDGLASGTPATGGVGGVPQGSVGGSGAAGTAALTDATAGAQVNSKAGGGGGGAGRIWLRHRASSPPTLTGSLISPAPGLDATLP